MTYMFNPTAERIRCAASRHVGEIVSRLIPGGTAVDGRYVVRKPRKLRRLKPLVVSLITGFWTDLATGTKGPDVVSLIAFWCNTSEAGAIRLISKVIHFRLPRPAASMGVQHG
ncbi:hypothetical protein KBI52_12280 [Microvirga sp. HBU67558]|uniref:hypothetical protein n=1 Tax=Microvirga sp. HBU67558 TaxID=2824562 RepID=UPI001B369B9D|nr:hypothetical protein [Microvirga sp. HBU67558]MBQ0820984.1 hypothetical protein [Microvirga sp. HBU67558]